MTLPDEFHITGFDDGGVKDGNTITFTYDSAVDNTVVGYKVQFDIEDTSVSDNKQNQAQIADGTVVNIGVTRNGEIVSSVAVTLTNPTNYSIIDEIKRVVPTTTASPTVITGQEYGYRIRFGAVDFDGNGNEIGNGYRTQITDTTVTIPVPAGFVLNSSDSGLLENKADGTGGITIASSLTFSQPDGTGGDVIVTLPAGKYLDDFNLYLAGSYVDGTSGTVTADGTATLTGTLTGQTITATASTPMSETIDTETYSTQYAVGNQNKSNTILLGSDTSGVNDGGMAYVSLKDNSNYETSVDYTVSIPDGMDITSVATPTTNFKNGTKFTITATDIDGVSYTKTVGMGETYSFGNTARIATINVVTTPLDPGDGSVGSFVQNYNYSYSLKLLGKLADAYDDGSSLAVGDSLTTTVTDNTTEATKSNTQTLTNVPVSALSADSITYSTPSTVLSSGDSLTVSYEIDKGKATFNGKENDATPFEPIVYVVAPENTVFDSDNPFTFDASNSDFDDVTVTKLADLNGREVYELDWTGTGDSPLIQFKANYVVKNNLIAGDTVSISPTIDNGNIFITSPESLVSVVSNGTNYFDNVADQAADTGWKIENDALYTYYKASVWQTAIPQTFSPIASIKSDSDSDYLNYDASDVAGTSATFKNSDTDNSKDGSVELLINNGSSTTYQNAYQVFNVGPYLELTDAGTTNDNGTLLYSTSEISDISSVNDITALDLKTAAQITDWLTVKAVVLETTNLIGSSAAEAQLPVQVTAATDDGEYHQETVQTLATNSFGSLATSTAQISLKVTQPFSYSVKVVDQDGNYISNATYPENPTTIEAGFVGGTVSAPDIAGYALTSGNSTVTLSDDGQSIVFVYGKITINATSKVYDGQPISNVSITTPNGGKVALTSGEYTLTDASGNDGTDTTGAGIYTIKLTDTGISDLQAKDPTLTNVSLAALTGVATILAKPVKLTGKFYSKNYGSADPTDFEATAEGLVGDDTLNYTIARNDKSEAVGSYYLTINLGDNPNYLVTTVYGTLTIKAIASTATVSYYDDTDNEALAATTDVTLTATTNTVPDVAGGNSFTIPAGYELAQTQPNSDKFTTTTKADGTVTVDYTGKLSVDTEDDITIHLVHKHRTVVDVAQTTDTVTYTGAKTNPDDIVTTINWTMDTDEVTNTTVWISNQSATTVMTPTVEGYTANHDKVDFFDITTETSPTAQKHTVTYTADAQTTHIQYVDDDASGVQVGSLTDLKGVTDGTADWTARVPAGYTLANNQAGSGTYTFAASNNAIVVIHLVHKHDITYPTTVEQVKYVDVPAGTTIEKTEPVTINWVFDYDEVANTTSITPSIVTSPYEAPGIAGYHIIAYVGDASVQTVASGQNPSKMTYLVNDPFSTSHVENAFNNFSGVIDGKIESRFTTGLDTVTVTIKYVPNFLLTYIQYVDDDASGAQVGDLTNLTGVTNSATDWTATVPAGYVLANGQASSGSYTFTPSDKNGKIVVVIHLAHKHTMIADAAQTTDTVTYTGAGDQNPANSVTTVNWTKSTDAVTKATVWVSDQSTTTVVSPTVTGYTADKAKVGFFDITTESQPTSQNATVTYSADPQSLTVTYVDDSKNGKQVGDTETLKGATYENGTYTVTVPVNYKLANGQSGKVNYQFTTDDTDNITVHLTHDFQYGTVETTQTINYVVEGNTTKNPGSNTQTVTYNTVTDPVTGEVSYTAQGVYNDVKSPAVAGYTPDQATVPGTKIGSSTTAPSDSTITVTYTGNSQQATVTYVDQTTGEVIKVDQVIGGSDSTSGYSTASEIADLEHQGYVLVSDAVPLGGIIFDSDDNRGQVYTVTLAHGYTGPTTPSEPEDPDYDATHQSVTETIQYQYADGSKAANTFTNTLDFTRTVTTDNVTGEKTYGEWTATNSDSFAAVDSPEITGYTPDQDEIAVLTVTAESDDINETVTYTANETGDVTQPGGGSSTEDNQTEDNQTISPSGHHQVTTNGSQLVTTAASVNRKQQQTNQTEKLPQTDESQNNEMATLGLGLMSILAMFGLAGTKKRQK